MVPLGKFSGVYRELVERECEEDIGRTRSHGIHVPQGAFIWCQCRGSSLDVRKSLTPESQGLWEPLFPCPSCDIESTRTLFVPKAPENRAYKSVFHCDLTLDRIYTLGTAGSCSLLGFFSSILATVSRCTSSGPSAKRSARAQAKN